MRHALRFFIGGCAVVAACASPGRQTARPAIRNLITADEIARVGATTALEAVERLQPRMLTKQRGPSSIQYENLNQIVVYLDGSRLGGVESLSLIQASSILEIRYLSASEATLRFGTGNPVGAIVVTSRT